MPKDVLCDVSSCNFWEQGNYCLAAAIYVVNQTEKEAESSMETDCKTFKPKH